MRLANPIGVETANAFPFRNVITVDEIGPET